MLSAHELSILSESDAARSQVLEEGHEQMRCEHKFTHVADVYVRGETTEFRMRCKNPYCLHVFSVVKETPDAMRHIRPIGER